MGDVRVHTGLQPAQACESINARAFTVGNHVAFNSGEYDPGSADGQHVLAHELAHVRQQTGGRLSMLPQEDLALKIDPDPELEKEAEETAQRVMRGGEVGVQCLQQTDVHVQRYPGHERVENAREEMSERVGESETSATPADPAILAKEVDALKDRQSQILETLSAARPGDETDGEWGKAVTKGAVGSLAGLGAGAGAGALLGSVVPGVGTAVGAAAGAAASGAAGDLTKHGVGWMADNRPGGKSEHLHQMYEEMRQMYVEMKDERVGTGAGDSTGDLNMDAEY